MYSMAEHPWQSRAAPAHSPNRQNCCIGVCACEAVASVVYLRSHCLPPSTVTLTDYVRAARSLIQPTSPLYVVVYGYSHMPQPLLIPLDTPVDLTEPAQHFNYPTSADLLIPVA